MLELKYKPMSKKQLCKKLDITYPTLRKWLKPIQNQLGDYIVMFTPRQTAIIYKHLDID